jgi:hypothetical protein
MHRLTLSVCTCKLLAGSPLTRLPRRGQLGPLVEIANAISLRGLYFSAGVAHYGGHPFDISQSCRHRIRLFRLALRFGHRLLGSL